MNKTNSLSVRELSAGVQGTTYPFSTPAEPFFSFGPPFFRASGRRAGNKLFPATSRTERASLQTPSGRDRAGNYAGAPFPAPTRRPRFGSRILLAILLLLAVGIPQAQAQAQAQSSLPAEVMAKYGPGNP